MDGVSQGSEPRSLRKRESGINYRDASLLDEYLTENKKPDIGFLRRKIERTCVASTFSGWIPATNVYQTLVEEGFRRPHAIRAHSAGNAEATIKALGMKLPKLSLLTPRGLIQAVEGHTEVPTFDVSLQDSGPRMTVAELAEYFDTPPEKRSKLYNVVSFSLADTPLENMVIPPEAARKLDLVSRVWPADDSPSPETLLYALMGPKGAYTDWHIDMGGSAVWYHVISGCKIFMIAPNTPKNIAAFESWSTSHRQINAFLGDSLENCQRVTLKAFDTLFLPSGWPHCVLTPEDSFVLGGNFLHSLDFGAISEVYWGERRLGVQPKFQFPLFRKLMFYSGMDILKHLESVRASSQRSKKAQKESRFPTGWELEGAHALLRMLKKWDSREQSAKKRAEMLPDKISKNVGKFLEKFEQELYQFMRDNTEYVARQPNSHQILLHKLKGGDKRKQGANSDRLSDGQRHSAGEDTDSKEEEEEDEEGEEEEDEGERKKDFESQRGRKHRTKQYVDILSKLRQEQQMRREKKQVSMTATASLAKPPRNSIVIHSSSSSEDYSDSGDSDNDPNALESELGSDETLHTNGGKKKIDDGTSNRPPPKKIKTAGAAPMVRAQPSKTKTTQKTTTIATPKPGTLRLPPPPPSDLRPLGRKSDKPHHSLQKPREREMKEGRDEYEYSKAAELVSKYKRLEHDLSRDESLLTSVREGRVALKDHGMKLEFRVRALRKTVESYKNFIHGKIYYVIEEVDGVEVSNGPCTARDLRYAIEEQRGHSEKLGIWHLTRDHKVKYILNPQSTGEGGEDEPGRMATCTVAEAMAHQDPLTLQIFKKESEKERHSRQREQRERSNYRINNDARGGNGPFSTHSNGIYQPYSNPSWRMNAHHTSDFSHQQQQRTPSTYPPRNYFPPTQPSYPFSRNYIRGSNNDPPVPASINAWEIAAAATAAVTEKESFAIWTYRNPSNNTIEGPCSTAELRSLFLTGKLPGHVTVHDEEGGVSTSVAQLFNNRTPMVMGIDTLGKSVERGGEGGGRGEWGGYAGLSRQSQHQPAGLGGFNVHNLAIPSATPGTIMHRPMTSAFHQYRPN